MVSSLDWKLTFGRKDVDDKKDDDQSQLSNDDTQVLFQFDDLKVLNVFGSKHLTDLKNKHYYWEVKIDFIDNPDKEEVHVMMGVADEIGKDVLINYKGSGMNHYVMGNVGEYLSCDRNMVGMHLDARKGYLTYYINGKKLGQRKLHELEGYDDDDMILYPVMGIDIVNTCSLKMTLTWTREESSKDMYFDVLEDDECDCSCCDDGFINKNVKQFNSLQSRLDSYDRFVLECIHA